MKNRLCCLMAVCLLAGCSQPGDPFATERVAVSGFVQVDGKAMLKGTIGFIPVQGTKGPRSGAEIENGIFSMDQKVGPVPGTYRVEILAIDPAEPDPDDAVAVQAYLEKGGSQMVRLPARYNARSELVETVSADQQNDFEFNLSTK